MLKTFTHFTYLGSDTLNQLIEEIVEVSSFDHVDLRIYTCSDEEREFDLLRFWTDEEKKSTLTDLGFKQGEIYSIDVDNFPRANHFPVKITTKENCKIILSGKNGPTMTVTPNTGVIRLDTTTWVS